MTHEFSGFEQRSCMYVLLVHMYIRRTGLHTGCCVDFAVFSVLEALKFFFTIYEHILVEIDNYVERVINLFRITRQEEFQSENIFLYLLVSLETTRLSNTGKDGVFVINGPQIRDQRPNDLDVVEIDAYTGAEKLKIK